MKEMKEKNMGLKVLLMVSVTMVSLAGCRFAEQCEPAEQSVVDGEGEVSTQPEAVIIYNGEGEVSTQAEAVHNGEGEVSTQPEAVIFYKDARFGGAGFVEREAYLMDYHRPGELINPYAIAPFCGRCHKVGQVVVCPCKFPE